jgi:hypothetical protein
MWLGRFVVDEASGEPLVWIRYLAHPTLYLSSLTPLSYLECIDVRDQFGCSRTQPYSSTYEMVDNFGVARSSCLRLRSSFGRQRMA